MLHSASAADRRQARNDWAKEAVLTYIALVMGGWLSGRELSLLMSLSSNASTPRNLHYIPLIFYKYYNVKPAYMKPKYTSKYIVKTAKGPYRKKIKQVQVHFA